MEEKEIKGVKFWKILLLLSFILFGISIYFYLINRPKEIKKIVINNNYSNQIINDLSFEKIKIYKKENKYYFSSKVINKTKEDINLNKIEIKLDNYSFNSFIGNIIKPGEYKMIFMETNKDISKIKNIKFIF